MLRRAERDFHGRAKRFRAGLRLGIVGGARFETRRMVRADDEAHIQLANDAQHMDGHVRTAGVITQVLEQYFFATIDVLETSRNTDARHECTLPSS